MIILRELILNNFLSHEKTDIKFENNEKVLIDGRSGSGKSSIVEALVWVLYGRGRADNNRNLIKRGKKIAKVIVYLGMGEIDYRIERSITDKGKHELIIQHSTKDNNFVPVKVVGIKNLQEFLEKEILHSSYTLFINSIVYPQDNAESFIKQPASKKKDLLLEIVNIEKYDDYYKRTRDKISELSQRMLSDNDMVTALKEINNMEASGVVDEVEVTAKLEEAKNKLVGLNNRRNTLEGQISETKILSAKICEKDSQILGQEININRCNKEIYDLTMEYDRLSDANLSTWKEQTQNINDNKKELTDIMAIESQKSLWNETMMRIIVEKPVAKNFDDLIADANKQLIYLMTNEPEADKPYQCPSCGATIDRGEVCPDLKKIADIHKMNIDRLTQTIVDLNREMDEYTQAETIYLSKCEALGPAPDVNLARKHELQEIIDKQEKWLLLINEAENKRLQLLTAKDIKTKDLNIIQKELEVLVAEKGKMTSLLMPINVLEDQLINLKSEIVVNESTIISCSTTLSDIKTRKQRIKDNIDKIAAIEMANKQNKLDMDSLELLKEALSPNGVKAMVIDYVIPYLEDKINNILSQLSDFRINLETQKETIDGESVIEGLFINIINELGEKSEFANYSGGEKLKIVVAISEALSEIQNIGFRILDEMFMALDSDSTENFVVTLQKIQSRFAQFICISHLQQIKDLFEKKIAVNKYNGTSSINI